MPQYLDPEFKRKREQRSKEADPRLLWLSVVLLVALCVTLVAQSRDQPSDVEIWQASSLATLP